VPKHDFFPREVIMPSAHTTRPEQPIALNLAKILFRLMTNPRGWRVDALKAELGIKGRTYRKYRSLLRDHFEHLIDASTGTRSLITQVRDGEAQYLRLRDSEEPVEDHPLFYTRIATLQLARQVFHFLRGTDVHEQMEGQYLDFLSRIGDRTFVFRDLLRDMDRKLYYRAWAPKDYSKADKQKMLRVIIRSLFYCRRVRVDYDSPNWKEPSIVEPLTLVLWRSSLYLIVRFKGDEKTYQLAVDRIKDISITAERFRYPSKETYSPQKLTRGSFGGVFHERDKDPTNVELIFANERWLKLDLAERLWHETQEFEELSDGRLRMTFTVGSMVEVWPWIRSYGDDVEVVRPKSP